MNTSLRGSGIFVEIDHGVAVLGDLAKLMVVHATGVTATSQVLRVIADVTVQRCWCGADSRKKANRSTLESRCRTKGQSSRVNGNRCVKPRWQAASANFLYRSDCWDDPLAILYLQKVFFCEDSKNLN